jgi:hypothetical protein
MTGTVPSPEKDVSRSPGAADATVPPANASVTAAMPTPVMRRQRVARRTDVMGVLVCGTAAPRTIEPV